MYKKLTSSDSIGFQATPKFADKTVKSINQSVLLASIDCSSSWAHCCRLSDQGINTGWQGWTSTYTSPGVAAWQTLHASVARDFSTADQSRTTHLSARPTSKARRRPPTTTALSHSVLADGRSM